MEHVDFNIIIEQLNKYANDDRYIKMSDVQLILQQYSDDYENIFGVLVDMKVFELTGIRRMDLKYPTAEISGFVYMNSVRMLS